MVSMNVSAVSTSHNTILNLLQDRICIHYLEFEIEMTSFIILLVYKDTSF